MHSNFNTLPGQWLHAVSQEIYYNIRISKYLIIVSIMRSLKSQFNLSSIESGVLEYINTFVKKRKKEKSFLAPQIIGGPGLQPLKVLSNICSR